MDSLQIPDSSISGPSRQNGSSRPVSVQAHPSPVSPPSQYSSSRKQRASHTVTSSSPHSEDQQPKYRDVYAHPAAQQYAASHPGRAIPKFGPYLLLQTLGEGEFGKVKLGLHTMWGEEAAVKLIKRHNIDSAVRMSKVEREIDVLRMLKHPNIVRLYDVIETDKYIGIILDYASGGELFDHILAHRYLKEKDACKLFAQLISGVWYIHERKIVHRDLKLENLLLDRNRNVIITDFGFANRFEHRADDLMQTSCGSPCYAAPELVISEDSYVGSAADIWSCGVILYAMLAGYLPFDDDPANPDGNDINLLYKYIVNTPLSFPDYISPEARDLLGIMLQPDPMRRASLHQVMAHPWLVPYQHLFDKSVADLENIAMELHRQKRLQYQRQMRQAPGETKVSRSQSARTDVFPHASVSGASASRSHSHRDPQYASPGQPEYLYETSVDQSLYASPPQAQSSRRGVASAIVLPTSQIDDDPFGPPSKVDKSSFVTSPIQESSALPDVHSQDPTPKRSSSRKDAKSPPSAAQDGSVRKKRGDMRHTIQVEFVNPEDEQQQQSGASHSSRPPAGTPSKSPSSRRPSGDQGSARRRPSASSATRATANPISPSTRIPSSSDAPTVTINPASPPGTPQATVEDKSYITSPKPSTNGSGSSKASRHRKGLSIDKIGLGKIFGNGEHHSATTSSGSRVPSESSYTAHSPTTKGSSRRPSTLQVTPSATSPVDSLPSPMLSPASASQEAVIPEGRKSRRSTLSVIANPLSGLKVRPRARDAFKDMEKEDSPAKAQPKSAAMPPRQPMMDKEMNPSVPKDQRSDRASMDNPASSNKARKVMQWFRSRSKGGQPEDDDTSFVERGKTPTLNSFQQNSSSTSVNANAQKQATPTQQLSAGSISSRALPQRTPSSATDPNFVPSFGERMMRHVAPNRGVLRVHHGAVDKTTITTGSPPEVMKHVREVLEAMGIEIQVESEYKYRCVRAKRKKAPGVGLGLRDPGSSSANGLAAIMMVGSAASNGVDKRGLPLPSQHQTGFGGGMLKGLLMRRQSSQVSAHGASLGQGQDIETPEATSPSSSDAQSVNEPVYGDATHDVGDEVRFYIELTRLDRLTDTFSLDIRRLKGNLRSYKFLYDTIRDRVSLQR
ncbi:hypothetical protein OF83DRAFT_396829 [Amylostereum chailletii]|nr:hypothetical protein OF83DRAFT_396829 [Amylostereum chailletii]